MDKMKLTDKKKQNFYDEEPNICIESIAKFITWITRGKYGFFVVILPASEECDIKVTKTIGNFRNEDTITVLQAEIARLKGKTPSLDLTGMDPKELDKTEKTNPN